MEKSKDSNWKRTLFLLGVFILFVSSTLTYMPIHIQYHHKISDLFHSSNMRFTQHFPVSLGSNDLIPH